MTNDQTIICLPAPGEITKTVEDALVEPEIPVGDFDTTIGLPDAPTKVVLLTSGASVKSGKTRYHFCVSVT